MLRTDEILSTIEMLHAEHLDVRTVTLALNADDCAAAGTDALCDKLQEGIVRRASRLVETCDRIGGKYGIPVAGALIAAAAYCEDSIVITDDAHYGGIAEIRTLTEDEFSRMLA